MRIKVWLKTITSHITKWHIQVYFDEFCSRINKS